MYTFCSAGTLVQHLKRNNYKYVIKNCISNYLASEIVKILEFRNPRSLNLSFLFINEYNY